MKASFVLALFLGATQAVTMKQKVAFWTQAPDGAPVENTCTNANKATGADETCDTAGNSAWNTHTSSRTASQTSALSPPYPGHAEHVQLGFWTQAPDGAPVENTCTNANKATGADETCDTAGNSAWNTHTSSRTASQTSALSPPYPGHALH